MFLLATDRARRSIEMLVNANSISKIAFCFTEFHTPWGCIPPFLNVNPDKKKEAIERLYYSANIMMIIQCAIAAKRKCLNEMQYSNESLNSPVC